MTTMQERFDRVMAKIESDIGFFGLSQIGVADEPPFIYTIGNHRMHYPEFLIVGMWREVGPLNELTRLMVNRGRRFDHGEIVDIGGSVPVKVVDATEEPKALFTFVATRYHGHSLYDVQQVVIPDFRGRFPGDPDCDPPWRDIPIYARATQ